MRVATLRGEAACKHRPSLDAHETLSKRTRKRRPPARQPFVPLYNRYMSEQLRKIKQLVELRQKARLGGGEKRSDEIQRMRVRDRFRQNVCTHSNLLQK